MLDSSKRTNKESSARFWDQRLIFWRVRVEKSTTLIRIRNLEPERCRWERHFTNGGEDEDARSEGKETEEKEGGWSISRARAVPSPLRL